jgi:hypothetical protein
LFCRLKKKKKKKKKKFRQKTVAKKKAHSAGKATKKKKKKKKKQTGRERELLERERRLISADEQAAISERGRAALGSAERPGKPYLPAFSLVFYWDAAIIFERDSKYTQSLGPFIFPAMSGCELLPAFVVFFLLLLCGCDTRAGGESGALCCFFMSEKEKKIFFIKKGVTKPRLPERALTLHVYVLSICMCYVLYFLLLLIS